MLYGAVIVFVFALIALGSMGANAGITIGGALLSAIAFSLLYHWAVTRGPRPPTDRWGF